MTPITSAGTYAAGDYYLASNMTLAGSALVFTGTATLDLNGKTIRDTTGGNTQTYGVVTNGAGSVIYDSAGGGKITGFWCGVKAGATTKLLGIDLSQNRYFGAWLASPSCAIIGGRIGSIGGVTDEKYAIGVQCDSSAPLVEGVIFDEMYPQAGYTGTGAGEGLPVNFAASCTGGVMRRCVAVNTVASLNTYGMFGGNGGGHTVEDCAFYNYWRAAALANFGSISVKRNFAWLRTPLAGSQGFSCINENVSDNVAIGYDAPISVVNLSKNLSIFTPYVASSSAPPPSSTLEGTIFNETLTSSFGNIDTKTVKVRLKPASMSVPSGAVTKIRLTLKGQADEPLTISKLYIGRRNSSGDAWDAVSFTQLQVSGASAFTIPAAGQLVTDWVAFPWNKTDEIIVSLYCNGGTSSDRLAANSGSTVGDTYIANVDSAATANDTGLTGFAGYLSLITKIETDGF